MADEKAPRLGALQLAILKTLWANGPSAVGDVHRALPRGAELAYTTVATMLRKMEVRGLVSHREEGRRFVYEAAVAEQGIAANVADDVLERHFEGRLSDLVSHLLDSRDVSLAELDRLEKLIAAKKKGQS